MVKVKVLWARMAGFPSWPARYCCAPEEAALTKKKPKSAKVAQSAVVFLGLNTERGWINDNSIEEFTSDTFDKHFNEKSRKDENYRGAIGEALRLCVAAGLKFSESIMKQASEWGQDVAVSDDETCSVCRGTGLSGVALVCDGCEKEETHLHCLRTPVLESDVQKGDNWYCDPCCAKKGIAPGDFHPSPEELLRRRKKEQKEAEKEQKRLANEAKDGHATAAIHDSGAESDAALDMIDHVGGGEDGLWQGAGVEAVVLPAIPEVPPIETDERCFVCDLGGKLLLCDFPKCPRVYHQACVLKSFPRAPDDNTGSAGMLEDSLAQEEPWFCPQHICGNPACRALQITDCPVSMLSIPSSVVLSQQAGRVQSGQQGQGSERGRAGPGLRLEKLKNCSGCPLALCAPCELDLGQGAKLFRNRKTQSPHELKSIECLTCHFKFPRIKLARLLEACFMKMASSRLALPFLRPLIPVPGEEEGGGEGEGVELESGREAKRARTGAEAHAQAREAPNGGTGGSNGVNKHEGGGNGSTPATAPADLLSLQERIRRLDYATAADFLADLGALRPAVVARLEQLLPAPKGQTETEPSPLLQAFDTLVQAADLFLHNPINAPLLPVMEAAVLEGDAERVKGSGVSMVCSIAEERIEKDWQARELLLRLWRRECEGPLWAEGRDDEGCWGERPHAVLPSSSPPLVLPRPARNWERFVSEGSMPVHLRGRLHEDPWDIGRFVYSGVARGGPGGAVVAPGTGAGAGMAAGAGAWAEAFGGNFDAGASVGVRSMAKRLTAREAAHGVESWAMKGAGWTGQGADAFSGAGLGGEGDLGVLPMVSSLAAVGKAGGGRGRARARGQRGGSQDGEGRMDVCDVGGGREVNGHAASSESQQAGDMDWDWEQDQGDGPDLDSALSLSVSAAQEGQGDLSSVLSELGVATARVLELETKARSQLAAQRNARLLSILSAGAGAEGGGEGQPTVALGGDTHLVQELHLAHLDLRWRLSQRVAAINSCALIEAGLQTACSEAAERLGAARLTLAEEKKKFDTAQRAKGKR